MRRHKTLLWCVAAGSILIGLVAILLPHMASIATGLAIGALLIANGVVAGIGAIADRERKRPQTAAMIGVGLPGIVAGGLLVAFPMAGLLTLTVVLAAAFLAMGLIKPGFAWQHRELTGWGWMVFSGVVSILPGGLIAAGLPGTAFWVLGLIIGIDMIFYGFALIALLSATDDPRPEIADQRTDVPPSPREADR